MSIFVQTIVRDAQLVEFAVQGGLSSIIELLCFFALSENGAHSLLPTSNFNTLVRATEYFFLVRVCLGML